jgi:hypothetical protein
MIVIVVPVRQNPVGWETSTSHDNDLFLGANSIDATARLFTGLEEHKSKINEFRPWLESLAGKK